MILRATYRLQFGPQFTFADAAAVVPYLAHLGISHLYASPWLKARAGSEHGYDIIDHAAFNPELGGEAGFARLHRALESHGLGQILDFVPNHMGIAKADNAWWLDVLEWGRASPFADFFDIDWEPADPDLHHKVLLPFLGDHYGAVLERGELQPRFDPDSGTFSVWYFDHRFPLAPRTWAMMLQAAATAARRHRRMLETLAATAERLRVRAGTTARGAARIRAEADALKSRLTRSRTLHPALHAAAAALAVRPGLPLTTQPLHRLLERQAYRLAYWRVAVSAPARRGVAAGNRLIRFARVSPENDPFHLTGCWKTPRRGGVIPCAQIPPRAQTGPSPCNACAPAGRSRARRSRASGSRRIPARPSAGRGKRRGPCALQ